MPSSSTNYPLTTTNYPLTTGTYPAGTYTYPYQNIITTSPSWIYPSQTISTGCTYLGFDFVTEINPLQKMQYFIIFDIKDVDTKGLLQTYIKGIRKNKILFNCHYLENRIQPYEIIMKLISENKKFSVKVKVCNTESNTILTINYTNFQFIEIENNLNFNGLECDFSVLKVKFKYEKVLYENHKLSKKEVRSDKLKKLSSLEK